jgi:predicted nucleotidyltransferase component of viral defense system
MPVSQIHTRLQEFTAALEFTAAETGFSPRLIEKDYWCSLVLNSLFASPSLLVFKGGTLLSKAYANFNRLSEDLDFTVPTPPEMGRAERSHRAHELELRLDEIRLSLNMEWGDPWRGHNNSTQHTGKLAYPTVYGGTGNIQIEVGQREILARPVQEVDLKTLLLNPLFSEPVLPPIKAIALSRDEAYAEKVRAALTRRDPAIRDIYDLWQASELGILPVDDPAWIELAKEKCAGYDLSTSCSDARKSGFERGIKTDLRPVLKGGATEPFDFNTAWNVVLEIQRALVS